MSAGGIIRRAPRGDEPVLKLSAWSPLKPVEPLLQYMQMTASQTLEIQERLLEEMKLLRAAIERAIGETAKED